MLADFLENTKAMGTNESLKKQEKQRLLWVSFLFSLDSGFWWPLWDFFSSWEYDEEEFPCPYRLSWFMSGRRFELLLSHVPSPQTTHLSIAIASGKFGRCLQPSRNTSSLPLSHLGSPSLMSPCLYGTLNGLALDGYSVQESHILKATNTIQFAVDRLISCLMWGCRGKR